MKLDVKRTEVWAAPIDDRPGGLAEKLGALAGARANLEFIIARRTPEKPGKGVVFVTPLKGLKVLRAAKAAGFQKAKSLHSLRLEGKDQPGIAERMCRALADAGINLRGVSGAVMDGRYVAHLALDTARDAARAVTVLRKMA